MEEDLRLVEEYKAKGYTITYPTDREAWVEATKPVYDKQLALHPEWAEFIEMVDAVR